MIPRDFVDSNLEKAKGISFRGVPLEKMTRGELIACAVAGWNNQNEMREDYSRRLSIIAGTGRN